MFALVVVYVFVPPGRYVQMTFRQTKGQAVAAADHSTHSSSDVEAGAPAASTTEETK